MLYGTATEAPANLAIHLNLFQTLLTETIFSLGEDNQEQMRIETVVQRTSGS